MGLSRKLFSRLQFNYANAQRGTHYRGEPRAIGIQHAAILTSEGLIVFRHPLFAHLYCILSGFCQLHICPRLKSRRHRYPDVTGVSVFQVVGGRIF